MSRLQSELLVRDIAKFYGQVRVEHLNSLERFDELFGRIKMEMLFYAGASPTVPYLHHVVGHLFSIALAYASIPFDTADKAPKFGWVLAYFLFFTQPAVDDVMSRVLLRVSLGTLNGALRQIVTSKDSVLSTVLGELHRVGALYVVPFVDHCIFSQAIFQQHESQGTLLVRDDKKKISLHDDSVALPKDLASELAEYEQQMRKIGL
jgi:hypothetical protein